MSETNNLFPSWAKVTFNSKMKRVANPAPELCSFKDQIRKHFQVEYFKLLWDDVSLWESTSQINLNKSVHASEV